MRGARRGEEGSFATYYLRRVAHSEGCGCAELIVSREWRAGEAADRAEPGVRSIAALWHRLRRALGSRRA